jgi:hypothetical protein
MKIKEKLVILVAAVMLSLVGFGLIAAPSADIVQFGIQASHGIVANYTVVVHAESSRPPVKG